MVIPERVLEPRAGEIPGNRWHRANGSLERPEHTGAGLAVMEPYGTGVRFDRYMEHANIRDDGAAKSIARDPMETRHKTRNDERDDFRILSYLPLPAGLESTLCGECDGEKLSGAIVGFPDGRPVIPSADADDPNILCLECGYWWD